MRICEAEFCHFLLQGSKIYMFFESKNSITMKGDIGVAESTDEGGTWSYVGIALHEKWHLSYPFVFEYDDEVRVTALLDFPGCFEAPLSWGYHNDGLLLLMQRAMYKSEIGGYPCYDIDMQFGTDEAVVSCLLLSMMNDSHRFLNFWLRFRLSSNMLKC